MKGAVAKYAFCVLLYTCVQSWGSWTVASYRTVRNFSLFTDLFRGIIGTANSAANQQIGSYFADCYQCIGNMKTK